ncbi:uncharacterized protein KIAA0895-like [Lingula anatina]|uniref:Uncharacterized protein KIAA0895-like n=1 Tax=Lingula anatina TaxID=7574 RepID=A0A1S3HCM4_LINAN|nr:uncharacterized protein KIAA0895-like [Lingula anatina]|eukprot:XP_013383773.1 uncharacterized protein KIAA0895-like [Lingula anatina]
MATAVSTTALLDSFSFQSSDDESERKKSIPQSRKRKKKRKRQSTGGPASRKPSSRDIRTLKPAWNYSGITTSSAMSSTTETTQQLLGFNVKRVELSSKPSNQMTRCASQQATWSSSTKLPSVQQTRASSVFSTNQTGSFQEKKKRKVALLVAIKPENVESEKARFFRASYNYHPLFIYKYPADPEVLARTSNPSDRYLTQSQ